MWVGLLGLVAAAAFTGAALYINLAEHPARMRLPMVQALAQWRPAYQRGLAMQASLAVFGGVCAMAGWLTTGQGLWLAGGLMLLLNWPYTLLAIMPVNRRLYADGRDDSVVRADPSRWNSLHGGRTLLGRAATLLGGAVGRP